MCLRRPLNQLTSVLLLQRLLNRIRKEGVQSWQLADSVRSSLFQPGGSGASPNIGYRDPRRGYRPERRHGSRAEVTITQPATGFTQKILTNTEGAYELRYLRPGEYTVEVAAGGFAPERRTNIVVQTGQAARLNFVAPCRSGFAASRCRCRGTADADRECCIR